MKGSSDFAAFVLAGGKSSRMGTDKAFLKFRSRTLLANALELARSVSPDVWIVGSCEKFAVYGEVVEDLFSGAGPLGAIHAALRSSQAELNLIIAVDMPLLSQAFLQYLTNRARKSAATVIAPYADGRWQPLCAVYRLGFAALAEDALKSGKNKIDSLFAAADTLKIEEKELTDAGFSSALFRNLNTPEEFLELKLGKVN